MIVYSVIFFVSGFTLLSCCGSWEDTQIFSDEICDFNLGLRKYSFEAYSYAASLSFLRRTSSGKYLCSVDQRILYSQFTGAEERIWWGTGWTDSPARKIWLFFSFDWRVITAREREKCLVTFGESLSGADFWRISSGEACKCKRWERRALF